jgi:hypothetical protein
VRPYILFAGTICFGAVDSAPATVTAADPLILQVQVVEGEGLAYPPGSRAVKGITVRVTDEVGRPVSAAAVSFRLPEDGATGVFQNNSKTEMAATSADGRATVWGMRWGKQTGTVSIRVTAAKGATRAGTIATQIISTSLLGPTISDSGRAYKSQFRGGVSKKWLWFGIAAAGAAGGGFAAYEVMKGGSSSSGAGAASTTGTSISGPTVVVGPH